MKRSSRPVCILVFVIMASLAILTKIFRTGLVSSHEPAPSITLHVVNIELEELDHDGRRNCERRRRGRYMVKSVAVRLSLLYRRVADESPVSSEHSISSRTEISDSLLLRWLCWFLWDVNLSAPAALFHAALSNGGARDRLASIATCLRISSRLEVFSYLN